jgi:chemotaxis protein histidine kinase CheA
MDSDLENLLPLFVSEAERILGEMADACGALLENADDETSRTNLCRGAHTIKGSAAVMSLSEISEFARVIERLMGCFSDASPFFGADVAARVRESISLAQQLVQEVGAGEGPEQLADRTRMAELAEIANRPDSAA